MLELARGQLRWLSAAARASSLFAMPCDGDILVAASLTLPEHDLLLRPGTTVPQCTGRLSPGWQVKHGLVVAEAPVRLPTGEKLGSIAAVIAVRQPSGAVSEAVARTARILSAALVH
ncbi:transcriptional regulator, IclR family protein [Amycolatopsis coloradensis]|uniref:transcriptional regulator, IclR family protein n=1 Tax=Amycolatopsis coloradensis TaxID=76021 RepID=UPI001ABFA4C0|nr:transcriptional regulator, IclR family protein [Amycolatopsis coloradensis]